MCVWGGVGGGNEPFRLHPPGSWVSWKALAGAQGAGERKKLVASEEGMGVGGWGSPLSLPWATPLVVAASFPRLPEDRPVMVTASAGDPGPGLQ